MKHLPAAVPFLLAMLWILTACAARTAATPDTVSVYLAESAEIIVIPYSDYITGRVLAQLPATAPREALAAAACAANSTALAALSDRDRRTDFTNNGADFADELPLLLGDDLTEALDGSERQKQLVSEAVAEGISHALSFDGEIVPAPMCAVSSGSTEDVSERMPWVEALSCPDDKLADGFESSAALTSDMVYRALKETAPAAILSSECSKWFSGAKYTASGALLSIDYGGETLDGRQLMRALGLRSVCVRVSFEEDKFVFRCKGFGENTGLSLHTASRLALHGEDMTAILSRFYPEAELIPCARVS